MKIQEEGNIQTNCFPSFGLYLNLFGSDRRRPTVCGDACQLGIEIVHAALFAPCGILNFQDRGLSFFDFIFIFIFIYFFFFTSGRILGSVRILDVSYSGT